MYNEKNTGSVFEKERDELFGGPPSDDDEKNKQNEEKDKKDKKDEG